MTGAARSRVGTAAAVGLAFAVLWAGGRWGAAIAGGSDSYGYVAQSLLWHAGPPVIDQPLIASSPWPNAAASWTPLGFRPSPVRRDAIAALYPPGYPWLMTLAQMAGGFRASFVVVPLCGAFTVWLTFALGRRLFDDPAALSAAALVAVSPVFLYQLMNPMSDVPATAAVALALTSLVSGRAGLAGVAAGLAIAIRPNLAPVGLALAAWAGARDLDRWRAGGHPGLSLVAFGAGALPGVLGLAWVNLVLYGSPLASGYADADTFFRLSFWSTNLARYPRWVLETQTPVVLLSLVGLIAAPAAAASAGVPRARPLLAGTVALVCAPYLFYLPFDSWSFLRFLLPAWPALMLLTAWGLRVTWRAIGTAWAPTALALTVLLVAGLGLRTAVARSAFDLASGERRYIDVARFVSEQTPVDAVILARQHSGSLRLYAGRTTMRWDVMGEGWLQPAVDHLHALGHPVYLVVDGDEADQFRTRFGGMGLAALDWAPLGTLNRAGISVFDLNRRTPASGTRAIGESRARPVWRADVPSGAP